MNTGCAAIRVARMRVTIAAKSFMVVLLFGGRMKRLKVKEEHYSSVLFITTLAHRSWLRRQKRPFTHFLDAVTCTPNGCAVVDHLTLLCSGPCYVLTLPTCLCLASIVLGWSGGDVPLNKCKSTLAPSYTNKQKSIPAPSTPSSTQPEEDT